MSKDMRTWITQLEKAGEMITIRQSVDPLRQMGALLSQSGEKALFFQDLKGFPGWRSLGQGVANLRHAALAFDTSLERLTADFAQRLHERVPCRKVTGGPVKEIVQKGDQVDLGSLPFHVNGAHDAAPYITSGMVVTKDPGSGVQNTAMYRMQVRDRSHTGIMSSPNHHASHHLRKYEERNEPMPVAVVIGHHPAYYFAATAILPYDQDEMELAGALLGEPVRRVACETIPLEVPCDAEIVIEGLVHPGVREDEGPFVEFQDYAGGEAGKKPVIEVQAITMRKDAIYKHVQNGAGVEGAIYAFLPAAAEAMDSIRKQANYLNVHNVVLLRGGFGAVVQMTPRFPGEAKVAMMIAAAGTLPKVVVAVDEDVNIFNTDDVFWAINTRVNPEKDITVIPNMYLNHLDLSAEMREFPGSAAKPRVGGKVLIDATKPAACDVEGRRKFERILPMGTGRVRLEDFLG
ncbi:MAG: UbiD family decarboxylase [Desulfobacterales bacterium]|nr:UbiD family decarboxylase [Desulfobacterales bacterium]